MSRSVPLLLALVACGPPPAATAPPRPVTMRPPTAPALPAHALPAHALPAPSLPAFVVATDCEPATRAAADVLARGGTAADAAIVAVLVAGLAHPSSSGLGGGGVAIVFDAESRSAKGYDFRITAPDPLPDASPWTLGGAAEARVGQPGELAGLSRLQRHAEQPWSEHVTDALAAADGLTVSPYFARALSHHPEMGVAFGLPAGQAVTPGTPLKRARLVETLRGLAELDAELPPSIAPGSVSEMDLLTVFRGERTIVTVPTAGGFVLWESLSLLPSLPSEALDRRHLQAEAFSLALEDRMRHAGGAWPLDSAHLEARRALLDPERHRHIPTVESDEGGTTNVAIVDAAGNAVIWSSSLGHAFGAGLVTDQGVVLNDGLTLFARPAEQRRFGPANAPKPGAKPAVSLAPTLVLERGKVAFALGASGGEHIPTALAQVLMNLDVDDPTTAPRLRTPVGGGLWLEAAEAELAPGLRARGHHVRTDLPDHSAVVMVAVDGEGRRGLVDPRRGGAVAVSPAEERSDRPPLPL